MSYVLKVRIQRIECLPAQSTNQLHIQLQPHPHFQWLRHSVAAPLSGHATNRKKPVQRRPVTLVPQRNPMQCRSDSTDTCTWLCALARKPQHLHAAAVHLSAAWTCSAGTAACHSQCVLHWLRSPAWLTDTWSASVQEPKSQHRWTHHHFSMSPLLVQFITVSVL